MARINIEEKWWGDPRRQLICDAAGDSYRVDGVFLRIIKTAQEYIKEGKPIPHKLFSQFPFSSLFIDHGMCESTENGVWLDGAQKHLGWLGRRVLAGAQGGKVTSPKKRDAAKAREQKKREIIEETDHKQNHKSTSKTTKAQASFSSSFSISSSDSVSSSSSVEKERIAPSNKLLEAQGYPKEYLPVHSILQERGVDLKIARIWLNTYPDPPWVVQQVLNAVAWETANPKSRKILFGKFVTNWMTRNWDKRTTQKQHQGSVRESGNKSALEEFKNKNRGGA